MVPGFTARYRLHQLLYYEVTPDVLSAIAREKQVKAWRRSKKLQLIRAMNPDWRDLSEDWRMEEYQIPRPDPIGPRNDKWQSDGCRDSENRRSWDEESGMRDDGN